MIKILTQTLKQNLLYTGRNSFFQHQKVFSYFSQKADYTKDYFTILNVNQNSTSEEIKKEYYKLVKQYHPDINKDNAEHFKLINEAYEVLGDDVKRNEYIAVRSNPFGNGGPNSQGTSSGQQQTYGQYYHYGNRRGQQYDYKRYEQSYYSTSDAQRGQGEFYNSSFGKSQFYQDMQNPYSNAQGHDFEPGMSAQEKMNLTTKKIFAFGFVILGFYLIFDVMVMRLLNSGPQYKIYDPETGQTFIADAQTLEVLKKRGYDTSFISPTDRDLQNRYGGQQRDERYGYQNQHHYDPRRERI